MSSWA